MSGLAALLQSARSSRGAKKVAVLWGAGCSRSAGIPLGAEWARELRQHPVFKERIETTSDDFMEVMQNLGSDIANLVINEKVRSAKVNWAHLALARLLRDEYISLVATLNFDPLVERACGLLNFWDLCAHDLANAENFRGDRLTYPSLCYLHGRLGSFVKRVTAGETAVNRQAHALLDFGRRWEWLVIGYGGGTSDKFLPLFLESGITKVHWCLFGNANPPPVPDGMILETIRINGADEFLMQLCAQLGTELPELFWRPKSLLERMNRSVIPYPLPETSNDLRAYTISKFGTIPVTHEQDEAFHELTKASLCGVGGTQVVRKYFTQIQENSLLQSIADGVVIQDARVSLNQAKEGQASANALLGPALLRMRLEAEADLQLLFDAVRHQAASADILAQWSALYDQAEEPQPEELAVLGPPPPEPPPAEIPPVPLDVDYEAADPFAGPDPDNPSGQELVSPLS